MKLPPVTSYRPGGFQGAFPRDFLPGSFYPQLLATMAQARLFCYPILGGACGPEAWATSVPNYDEVSGHEFLISHLLQDRLGLEEGFFRSRVLFILVSTVLYPNPFRDGEGFCAVVWIGKVETSGKARDWLGGTPTIISVFIPVGTRAPLHFPSTLQILLSPPIVYPSLSSSSFAPWREEEGDSASLQGEAALGRFQTLCHLG